MDSLRMFWNTKLRLWKFQMFVERLTGMAGDYSLESGPNQFESLLALTQGTSLYKLVRPQMTYENVIMIKGGRWDTWIEYPCTDTDKRKSSSSRTDCSIVYSKRHFSCWWNGEPRKIHWDTIYVFRGLELSWRAEYVVNDWPELLGKKCLPEAGLAFEFAMTSMELTNRKVALIVYLAHSGR